MRVYLIGWLTAATDNELRDMVLLGGVFVLLVAGFIGLALYWRGWRIGYESHYSNHPAYKVVRKTPAEMGHAKPSPPPPPAGAATS